MLEINRSFNYYISKAKSIWLDPQMKLKGFIEENVTSVWKVFLTFFVFKMLGIIALVFNVQEFLKTFNRSFYTIKPSAVKLFVHSVTTGLIGDIAFFSCGVWILWATAKRFGGGGNLLQIWIIILWSWIIPSALSHILAGSLQWIFSDFGRYGTAHRINMSISMVFNIWCMTMFFYGLKELDRIEGRYFSVMYFLIFMILFWFKIDQNILFDEFAIGTMP